MLDRKLDGNVETMQRSRDREEPESSLSLGAERTIANTIDGTLLEDGAGENGGRPTREAGGNVEHGTNSHFYVVDILDKWTDQATSVGREGVGAWLGITKIVLETERRRGRGEGSTGGRQICTAPSCRLRTAERQATAQARGRDSGIGGWVRGMRASMDTR